MQKVTRYSSGILFLLLVVFTGVEAHASGYAVVTDDQRIKFSKSICVVEVESLSVKENKRFYPPNTIRTFSPTYRIQGTVIESLKGECGQGDVVSEYTAPSTVIYGLLGEIVAYATVFAIDSGLESNVMPGKRYILSYLAYSTEDSVHKHDRVDGIGALNEILEFLDINHKCVQGFIKLA